MLQQPPIFARAQKRGFYMRLTSSTQQYMMLARWVVVGIEQAAFSSSMSAQPAATTDFVGRIRLPAQAEPHRPVHQRHPNEHSRLEALRATLLLLWWWWWSRKKQAAAATVPLHCRTEQTDERTHSSNVELRRSSRLDVDDNCQSKSRPGSLSY